MSKYTVVNKQTHKAHRFDNMKQVTIFLWGRDLKRYAIMKTKRLYPVPANISELEKQLEAL